MTETAPAADQTQVTAADQGGQGGGEEVGTLVTSATSYKLKSSTLPGTPVTTVIGAQANTFWTGRGWAAGLAGDVITPQDTANPLPPKHMTISGTPPTGFAGAADVVQVAAVTNMGAVPVWQGKGWT